MTHDRDTTIDFEMLRKLSEEGLRPSLMRPDGVAGNTLGFLAIDPMDVEHGMHIVLQAGQVIEQERGGAGFNPNTVAQVWPDNQLSIDGLISVARNFTTWNNANTGK